jgi:hypothetical protein
MNNTKCSTLYPFLRFTFHFTVTKHWYRWCLGHLLARQKRTPTHDHGMMTMPRRWFAAPLLDEAREHRCRPSKKNDKTI